MLLYSWNNITNQATQSKIRCYALYREATFSGVTAQEMKFSIKIYSFVRIWSHVLKISLMENVIFGAVREQ